MDLDEKRARIIELIRKNPSFTYKKIRAGVGFHIEGIFNNGLQEAFEKAGVAPPRNIKKRTTEENKKIIIEYIKKHPRVGCHTIRKDTKINFSVFFPTIAEAYAAADVEYPRKESYEKSASEKRKELINTIRKNPRTTVTELIKKIKTNPYHFYKNMACMYKAAGVERKYFKQKRGLKKRKEIIDFIKKNPLATQREINTSCRTHVQGMFEEGIFGAYKEAGIRFPFERLKLYGVGLKNIRNRATEFEDNIARKLSGFGKVNRLVKTKRGFADIIFERKGKKAIIEVKDYESKEISISQINQLNKYLEDCGCELGFLVCFKKPKRDSFLIGKNKIILLEESELGMISDILDGCIV